MPHVKKHNQKNKRQFRSGLLIDRAVRHAPRCQNSARHTADRVAVEYWQGRDADGRTVEDREPKTDISRLPINRVERQLQTAVFELSDVETLSQGRGLVTRSVVMQASEEYCRCAGDTACDETAGKNGIELYLAAEQERDA